MSTFNGERFLLPQIQSIFQSKIKGYDISLYIRDDGSSDDTLSIIENLSKKYPIKVFPGKNIGPALSFWTLFLDKEIEADYFAFSDQDDIWDSDKLSAGINVLSRMDNTGIYFCNYRLIDEKDRIISPKGHKFNPDLSLMGILVCGPGQGCSMIFSQKFRNQVYTYNIEQVPMHDISLFLIGSTIGHIYYDDAPHFSYRIHANNYIGHNKHEPLFVKIQKAVKRWKNYDKKSFHLLIQKLCQDGNIKPYDRRILESLLSYKRSFRSRLFLLRCLNNCNCTSKAKASFKLKLILNRL